MSRKKFRDWMVSFNRGQKEIQRSRYQRQSELQRLDDKLRRMKRHDNLNKITSRSIGAMDKFLNHFNFR